MSKFNQVMLSSANQRMKDAEDYSRFKKIKEEEIFKLSFELDRMCRTNYTEEEVGAIEYYYPIYGARKLSEFFYEKLKSPRTYIQIKEKAKRLGVRVIRSKAERQKVFNMKKIEKKELFWE